MTNFADTEPFDFDDDWVTVQEPLAGSTATIRVRPGLDPIVGSDSYPELLLIRWRYEPALLGQPSSADAERMDAFERAAIDDLEMDWTVVFFCVLTHEGRREWMGYCGDVEAATQRLNESLESHPQYPLELVSANDPDWLEYRDLVGEG